MLRKIFHDSAFYTLSAILSRGILLLLLPLYAQKLSPFNFGLIDYIQAIFGFLSILIGLELIQGLARFIPDSSIKESDKKIFASTFFIFCAIASFVFLIIFIFLRESISILIFGVIDYSEILILPAISFWISYIHSLFHNQLRWELKSRLHAFISIITALLVTVFTFIFLMFLDMGLNGVWAGHLIGHLIALPIAWWCVKGSLGLIFNVNYFNKLFKYSIPLLPSSLLLTFSLSFDKFAIKEFLSFDELGIYSFAQKISIISGIALVGLRAALVPIIFSRQNEKDTPLIIANIFKYFLFITSIFLVIIICFRFEIIKIFSSFDYYGASNILPLTIISSIVPNIFIFSPGLELHFKTKTISIIFIIISLLNILLNIILIPYLGLYGAASASIFSFILGFIFYVYFGQRLYYIPHQWPKIFIIIFGLWSTIFFVYFFEFHHLNFIFIRIILIILFIFIISSSCNLSYKKFFNFKFFLGSKS